MKRWRLIMRVVGAQFLLGAQGVLFQGCGMLSPAACVLVQVPEPPPHWRAAFPGLAFVIAYRDASGVMQEKLAAGWRERVPVELGKGANTAVLAWPVAVGDPAGAGTAGGGALRPSGGLYPLHLSSSLAAAGLGPVLVLSWEDGPLAEIFQALFEAGIAVSLLNAERIAESLRARPDPWVWDIAGITQGLADGSFSAYDMDELPRASVTIQAGQGEWFLETPFCGTLDAGQGGEITLEALSYGQHTLFSSAGDWIVIHLDAKGPVLITPGARCARP